MWTAFDPKDKTTWPDPEQDTIFETMNGKRYRGSFKGHLYGYKGWQESIHGGSCVGTYITIAAHVKQWFLIPA